MVLGLSAVQHVDIAPVINSVAAVHHSAPPPLMVHPQMDNKVRPSPIPPIIQNTNQVIVGLMLYKYKHLETILIIFNTFTLYL